MKFTEHDVEQMRKLYWAREMTQKELAIRYNTNQSMISRIISEQLYTRAGKVADTILERDVEKALVRRIEQLGGVAEKFTSPGRRSVPDRLCLVPPLPAFFVELKAPGKKPTKKQQRDHERRRAMGYDVYVIDNVEDAMRFAPKGLLPDAR